MRNKTILITLLAAFAMIAAACGGETPKPSNGTNTNAANANTAPPAGNTALETTKKPETATTNDAPTLGPVINAYYDALRNKDAAGVRKVMESGFLKSIEEDMKAEKKTDIVAFLTETDKLPTGKMEARNEKIIGNKGTAEIKGGSYATWFQATFVNEGGVWKVSNQLEAPGGHK